MVKGVNKSVIEISETGSKYFSRVILFVAPEYVEKKSKKLTAEAASVIRKIQMSSSASLRDIISAERKRKKRLLIGICGYCSNGTTAVTFLINFKQKQVNCVFTCFLIFFAV